MKLKPLENIEVQGIDIQVSPPKSKGKNKGPWYTSWNKNKLKKPNMVAVLFLRNNGVAEPMEVESKKGMLDIYGKTYHENTDCIWSLNKNRIPLAIIPQWSLIPIGTKRWDDRSMLEKFAELQDHTLRGIRHAELVKMGDKDAKKMTGKQIVGLVILAIIGLAIANHFL